MTDTGGPLEPPPTAAAGWRARLPGRRGPVDDAPLPTKGSDWPLALLFLAPSLVVFGVFVFWPLGRTLWLGQFEEDPFGRRRTYLVVERFWDVFQSDAFQSSLWVPVKFTLMSVPLGLALGLCMAVMPPQPH